MSENVHRFQNEIAAGRTKQNDSLGCCCRCRLGPAMSLERPNKLDGLQKDGAFRRLGESDTFMFQEGFEFTNQGSNLLRASLFTKILALTFAFSIVVSSRIMMIMLLAFAVIGRHHHHLAFVVAVVGRCYRDLG